MSIEKRLIPKEKEETVLVQGFMAKTLVDKVKSKIKKLDERITMSAVIRASLEEFVKEKK